MHRMIVFPEFLGNNRPLFDAYQESIPDQSKEETKGGVTGGPGTEHSGSKPDIPSEDDLTEDEKKMLSDARRFPCYLSRLRRIPQTRNIWKNIQSYLHLFGRYWLL